MENVQIIIFNYFLLEVGLFGLRSSMTLQSPTTAVHYEGYFHGFLPREDVQALLRIRGQFLVRCSDVEHNGVETREYIISVLCSGPTKSGKTAKDKIFHVVIHREDEQFRVKKGVLFQSISLLVSYYRKNEMTASNGVTTILEKPVDRAKWELLHADVELGSHLGKGEFGEVLEGKLKLRKKTVKVAVKITKGKGELSKIKRNQMMREARLARNLKHVNVVRMYGVAVLEQPLYIVLELVDGGSLDTHLRANKGNVPVVEKVHMMLDAAWGLEFIHSKNIIHRDLAARNCLYSSTKRIKISDFGMSRVGGQYKLNKKSKIPVKWLSPECFKTLLFTQKSDVYSFGVLCWEIFTDGAEPWGEKSPVEIKRAVKSGEKLQFPSCTPPEIMEFLDKQIFTNDGESRASIEDTVTFLEGATNIKQVDILGTASSKSSSKKKLKKTTHTNDTTSRTRTMSGSRVKTSSESEHSNSSANSHKRKIRKKNSGSQVHKKHWEDDDWADE